MIKTNNMAKIEFLCEHARSDVNLCVAAYQLISKSPQEEQAVLLERFIRCYRQNSNGDTLDIPQMFDEKLKTLYMRKYQTIVDGQLERLLNLGLSKKNFYEELVNYILTDKNLLDDAARAIAIYDCCIDRRLPYAQVDLNAGMKFEDEEFYECLKALGDDSLDKVIFILNADLQQKSERASLLLQELDSFDNPKLKTVLFCAIMDAIEGNAIRKAKWLSHFSELITEED